MIASKYYDIDIANTGAHPIVRLSQYDAGGVEVVFTVHDGSELANIDDCTARVDGTRTDGAAFSVSCDVSTGAQVSFTVAPEMTNGAGKHEAELVFMSGDSIMSTQNFIIDVERAAMRRDAAAVEEDRTLYDQFTSSVTANVNETTTDMTNKVNAAIEDSQTKTAAAVKDSQDKTAAAVADARSQMDAIMAAGAQKKISTTLNSGTDYTLTIPR